MSTLQSGNTKKFNLAIKKKSEKNTTIRKFSRKEEDQPCHQKELSRSTEFSKPRDREVTNILVLIKRDRQMRCQVDQAEDKDQGSG